MSRQVIEAQMGQHPKTQAPYMALDNEIEIDVRLKVLAKSCMQQWASKRATKFEAIERREKGLAPHKV